MTFNLILITIIGALCILIICIALKKTKNPFKEAFLNALCGVASLGAVNLFALQTGVFIAVNYFTAFVVVVLGAPGTISLLILRAIFEII